MPSCTIKEGQTDKNRAHMLSGYLTYQNQVVRRDNLAGSMYSGVPNISVGRNNCVGRKNS